jgi:selenocysteine lyase/cysteine desulfurase
MLERGAAPLFVDMRGADWTDPDAFRLVDGARRFEKWESAYALTLGLGAAVRYALEVGEGGQERAWRLAALLRERLAGIPGAVVLDRGTTRCAIVTVAIAGRDPAELKRRLRARGINTSVSDRQDAVLDMDEKHVTAVLRLSPHYYNTEDELDTAVGALTELARA